MPRFSLEVSDMTHENGEAGIEVILKAEEFKAVPGIPLTQTQEFFQSLYTHFKSLGFDIMAARREEGE